MTGDSYCGYKLSLKEKRDCVIISYIFLFIASYIFYHSLFLSAISVVLLPICIKRYEEAKAEKRKELLLTQFRDLLYSLSASFAAGRHMRDGLFEAKENLSLMYANDTPMMAEISDMLIKIDESRASEEEVLRDFAQRSGAKDIKSFFDTYFSCRETGGDLNSVILKSSGMLIDKIGIEKEIKVFTSQKCFEGKIISLMPVVVILFLNIVSPEYIEVLYTTFSGRIIMTVALAGIAYSYHVIAKLTKIEV